MAMSSEAGDYRAYIVVRDDMTAAFRDILRPQIASTLAALDAALERARVQALCEAAAELDESGYGPAAQMLRQIAKQQERSG